MIRPIATSDVARLAPLRHALWPKGSVDEHAAELDAILAGEWSTIYPYAVFVYDDPDANLIGFAEVTLRSRADDCDPSRPAGYLEGWYVSESHRRRGAGRELLRAAEVWSRAQGCTEMASDTWLDNEISQQAHESLGFAVVDRCVHYKKTL